MIIDDDEVSNYIFSKLSTISGFAKDIVSCQTGAIALDYLQKNIKHPSHLPEVIFLDLHLPDMEGWDFITAYEKLDQEVWKKIYLVILTTSVLEDDQIKAKKFASVKKFLVKPITSENLKSLSEVLKSRESKDRTFFSLIFP